jgi:hypothetical protein
MITSPFLPALQTAHQHQGQTNHCGPFCAAITASALKQEPHYGTNFVDKLRPIRWKGILPVLQRIPDWATMPWGTTFLLNDLGFKAQWTAFSTQLNLFTSLPENLVQIVIIGKRRPVWAHYLILAAYEARMGYGFIDPALANADLHWYLPAEFAKLWNNYGRVQIKVYPGD